MCVLLPGKGGVYVTLKGKSMVDSVDSKLPRVTGISLPKIRKSYDTMDELMYANQPPPTPVDASLVGQDRNRFDQSNSEARSIHQIKENVMAEEDEVEQAKEEMKNEQVSKSADIRPDVAGRKAEPLGDIGKVENTITERKSLEIGPNKNTNFTDRQGEDDKSGAPKGDNVAFFVTEQHNNSEEKTGEENDVQVKAGEENDVQLKTREANDVKVKTGEANDVESKTANEQLITDGDDVVDGIVNDNSNAPKTNKDSSVDVVIKVEVNESNRKNSEEQNTASREKQKPLTSDDFPFEEKK